MKKLNIYIPRAVHSAIKEESANSKIRMSEVVRRKVDSYLKEFEDKVMDFVKSKQPRRTDLQRTNLYFSKEQLDDISKETEAFECTKADFIRHILARSLSEDK